MYFQKLIWKFKYNFKAHHLYLI